MQKQFDVEILHHILNYFSENLIRDCSRIIDKILKSSVGPSLNDYQDKKAFASLEVLLRLYEKLQEEDKLDERKLPVHSTVQSIQYILQCSKENCRLPDIDVQHNILSIMSLLFKNALLQSNLQSLEELIKVNYHTLVCLQDTCNNTQCKTDCLLFKLKIVNSVYYSLNTFAPNNVKFHDMFNLINNFDECKLFGDFVLYQNDDVAIQTLMFLIPEYVNCFKSGRIIEVIWKQISDSVTDSRINHLRVLTVLCKIFDICFEKSTFEEAEDLIILLLGDSNYWKLVQTSLIEEDLLKRKQGMYLLKKTIDVLNNTCISIDYSKEKVIFYWHLNSKDELYKIYSEIIIIIQFLDEQQVHIIRPIFGMIESLVKKITENGKVSYSWILLLYKKALMHESTEIVKWGLSSILKLPEDFFSNEYFTKEMIELLLSTLNNLRLYYSDGQGITIELRIFFTKIIRSWNKPKAFFSSFIKCLCRQVWSAETLFFVIQSLSEINTIKNYEKTPLWGQKEIFEVKEFVSKAFKTHNKIIRTAVQCMLLQVVSYLTNPRDVPLENLIVLLSRLSFREILLYGNSAWEIFTDWILEAYPAQEFKNIIDKYKRGELEKELNEKCMSLIIISGNIYGDIPYTENYLQEILLSFREIDKRLYCNKSLQNQYLSVIVHICEANVNNSISGLIKLTLPFVRDVILYIQIQLQQISSLQDFGACQFYLNAFENIIKSLVLCKANTEYVNELYVKVVKDLKLGCLKSDTSCIRIYYKMKLLTIILQLCHIQPKSDFWDSYLSLELNKPLKKDNDCLSQTRNFQTLWGRMNSEFLEGKWRILECLIYKNIITFEPLKIEGAVRLSKDNLVQLCVDAINTGGYSILCPVMSVLKNSLLVLQNILEIKNIIELIWKVVSERRKTEEFKLFIKHFVEMLFQEGLIQKEDFVQQILFEYTDLIFSDSSLAVVDIFIKHIQQINIPDCSVTLFCHILGKGLLFGPVQKKDEKLTNEICYRIESLKICEARKICDFNLSQKIRARAVQKILMLDEKLEAHKTAAKDLIDTLLKMESEINKNRVRYFGDSHTHRVKHRLMQALLLLEPFLDINEERAIELSKWLLDCLVNENSQPSVRYMQEWLLIRMSVRHSKIHTRFIIDRYVYQDVDVSKKTLCSLMIINFHLCRLLPYNLMESEVQRTLHHVLFLSFHQHIEVRLYAQLIFRRLYEFAESRKLCEIIKDSHHIYETLTNLHERLRKATKGNFKSLFNLTNDFYITSFKPLEHYSLEMIYMDLPRLTNAGVDERISVATFKDCGVESYKMSIPLRNEDTFLKFKLTSERCMKFNSDTSTLPVEHKSEENYQKKIIPKKPLIPVWDETGFDQQRDLKKDGLIVVASLIDRIPNLGGLARTSEIFGASEYVISSLKYTEDKQFTSLSVTAEKWIRIKEVKPQNLLAYVLEMKQNGYTVIGAEQALHSLSLSEVKFPKKSLLLLGNEKEGIPPNLLPLLDICVEIPQLGIIRSLNVHVTGALFIWEYAKQNLFF